MIYNVPVELQQLDQWVVASGVIMPDGKRNKEPLNPRTGKPAKVTDRSTWGSFADAQACSYPLIGFVLSKEDPYCIIDLDPPETEQQAERHGMILAAFETYTELSQSGHGMHIICRGQVPHGVRRDKVEIYSDSRYMICTGVVFKALPIIDCQTLLTPMFEQMNALQPMSELVQIAGTMGDDDMYDMASRAVNADKFAKLWSGEWRGVAEWPSQSEADFALLSMLCFYSRDNEQVRRMFRYSALGKRDKAVRNDDYLNRALSKIRAKEIPAIDFSKLLNPYPKPDEFAPSQNETDTLETSLAATGAEANESLGEDGRGEEGSGELERTNNESGDRLQYPAGFIGELAEYFYSSAIRPVPEIALAAAIALTAGVAGRAYNISGSGLNQYLVVIAPTGRGKEGVGKGIDMMVAAVRSQCPMVDQFIGPGAFASGQALLRTLDRTSCFVSVLGEVGLTLQAMCDPKANAAYIILKKVLLDIYAKSGWQSILRPNVYSESEKNTKVLQAPNVTIFGESSPESFYDGLDSAAVASGLIPRFSVFEYNGPRPARNRNAFQPPPKVLVDKFVALLTCALAGEQARTFCPVATTMEAQLLLDTFDIECDEQMNSSNQDVNLQLWNRGHLKALKLAALIAVGENPYNPIVSAEAAQWAIDLIKRDITKLLAHFQAGDIGMGDMRLEADLRRAVDDYLRMSPKMKGRYQVPFEIIDKPIIPLGYLRKRLRGLASFRQDRRGANAALTAILKTLVEADELQLVSPLQAVQEFKINSALYVLGKQWSGLRE